VPYNLLAYLTKVAPKDAETDYITQKLREYGYLKQEETPSDLKQRIEYALNWNRDFMEIKETAMQLNAKERNALEELTNALQTETEADQIQSVIFSTARKHGIPLGQFFKTLYTILLGTPSGPKLGPYIVAMGRQNVIEAFERALKKQEA
jgi:lysyl-tRNA synthetase class 1